MIDPARYCSLGKRGWTDLVLNMTSIDHEDIEYHLTDLAALRYPRETFPTILHELVHHWCFTSPVATALALLHARALRTALERQERIQFHIPTDDIDTQLTDDIIKYETTMAYLRPIAEGLAMFAEFDAYTREEASFVSIPLRWIYLAYTELSPEQRGHDAGAALNPLLFEIRFSPYYRRRKTELLLQPFQGPGSEYLLGYLTIKKLYATGTLRTRAFQNTDFALIFLRDWFYNDFGLVDAILNNHTGSSTGEAIAKYLNDRINDFIAIDLDKAAQKIVAHLNTNPPPPPLNASFNEQIGYLEPLNETAETLRGIERLRQLYDELHEPSRSMTIAGQKLRDHLHWDFLQRELMCIASINVVNEPHGDRMIRSTVDGQPLFDMELLPDKTLEAPAEGTLEYHINPSGPYHFFAISDTKGEPLGIFPMGAPMDEMSVERFRGQRFSTAERIRMTDMLRQGADAILKNVQDRELADLRELLAPTAATYFFNVVFDTDDEHPLRTSETGLLPLLNGDLDFLANLGVISLVHCFIGSYRAVYRQLGELIGEDLDGTIARFEREGDNEAFHFFDLNSEICSPYF